MFASACIDTSEVGDLSVGVDLGEYRHTQEWTSLTSKDAFTVTINVHNEGNLLEIVGMCCEIKKLLLALYFSWSTHQQRYWKYIYEIKYSVPFNHRGMHL